MPSGRVSFLIFAASAIIDYDGPSAARAALRLAEAALAERRATASLPRPH